MYVYSVISIKFLCDGDSLLIIGNKTINKHDITTLIN